MSKTITCIECPKSCSLSIDIENCRVVKVRGNQCKSGYTYAVDEVENPQRIFTSTVASRGLSLKMIPVRTDKPIPKARILEAAQEIRKIKISKMVKSNETIVQNFLGLGVSLIATRDCP